MNKRGSSFRSRRIVLALAVCTFVLPIFGEALGSQPIKVAAAPTKQIYELSSTVGHSEKLNADGVAAYVVSALGTNRGFLVKQASFGLASSIGIRPGDIILSFDDHVVVDARAADSILSSLSSGNVHVRFVHPDNGTLQLYNAPFQYSNQGPLIGSTNSGYARSQSGSQRGRQGKGSTEIEFSPAVESYAVDLINKDRQDNGAAAVHVNNALTAMARSMAKDMIQRNYMSHTDPDGHGPQERAELAGISRMGLANLNGGVYENLSYNISLTETPSQAVRVCQQRMMSEPKNQENHRFNILMPKHVSVGVGVAIRGPKVTMVQEFSDTDP
ncbi:MAG TPA: CAP domain-containing protein [Trichormus sp.]